MAAAIDAQVATDETRGTEELHPDPNRATNRVYSVRFPDEVIEHLRLRARIERKPVSVRVRELVASGLEGGDSTTDPPLATVQTLNVARPASPDEVQANLRRYRA